MILATDASFCAEAKMAGIAVHSNRWGKIIAVEVVPARSSAEAEALAMIRACTHMATWEAPMGSKIWTDCRSVTLALMKRPKRTRGDAVSELAAMIKRHGWIVEDRPRQDVAPAHVAARGALRAWKAGGSGEPTWKRSMYLPAG